MLIPNLVVNGEKTHAGQQQPVVPPFVLARGLAPCLAPDYGKIRAKGKAPNRLDFVNRGENLP